MMSDWTLRGWCFPHYILELEGILVISGHCSTDMEDKTRESHEGDWPDWLGQDLRPGLQFLKMFRCGSKRRFVLMWLDGWTKTSGWLEDKFWAWQKKKVSSSWCSCEAMSSWLQTLRPSNSELMIFMFSLNSGGGREVRVIGKILFFSG